MIPIGFCEFCQENMPMVYIDYEEKTKNKIIPVIFCPQCENLLNAVDNVRLTWIDEAELPKYTEWKLTDELSE